MSGLAMKCKSMEPPDMELVVAFYEKLQKRTASPQQIREIALREIDNKVKMRSLKDVILS
jgi:hypothetical protein